MHTYNSAVQMLCSSLRSASDTDFEINLSYMRLLFQKPPLLTKHSNLPIAWAVARTLEGHPLGMEKDEVTILSQKKQLN